MSYKVISVKPETKESFTILMKHLMVTDKIKFGATEDDAMQYIIKTMEAKA